MTSSEPVILVLFGVRAQCEAWCSCGLAIMLLVLLVLSLHWESTDAAAPRVDHLGTVEMMRPTFFCTRSQ